MTSIAKTILVGVTLSLLATGAFAQVVNGSFEPDGLNGTYYALPGGSTAIPGWEAIDTGVEWFQPLAYNPTPAPHGLYIVDIANYTYSAGGIRQTIPTDPGTVYRINFFLGTQAGLGRDGTCEITVEADGQIQTFSLANYATAIAWESKTFIFTADDTSADLTFRCLQNANNHFAYIDAVDTEGTVDTVHKTMGSIKSMYR